jgi:hypothetical protein
MEEPLHACPTCDRYVRSADAICPFCAAPRVFTRFTALAGAVVTPIVLAACYGSPPCDEAELVDADGDGSQTCSGFGYVEENEDCDDTNSAVHPGATEVCGDGLDNDCNFTVDDGCDTDGGDTDDTDGDTN